MTIVQKNRFKILRNLLFYFVISLSYYCLIRQYVKISDDLYYTFIHPGKEIVNSFTDAIKSQTWDYFNFNGRVVVHTIVQYLCGVKYGSEIYFIISTLVFALLIRGIEVLLHLQYDYLPKVKQIVVMFLFFFIPWFGMTFIGQVSFVANYMWSSTLFIWFYNLYYMVEKERSEHATVIRSAFLFIFGLLFGLWQESFTIPVAGALTIYHVFHYKEFTSRSIYFHLLIIGFIIGLFFEVFAPANFLRLNSAKPNGISLDVGIFSAILDSVRLISLLCIFVTAFVCLRAQKRLSFLKKNWFFLYVIIFNVLFAVLVQFHDHRQLTVGFLCLIILCIKLLYENKNAITKHLKAFTTFVNVLTIVTFIVFVNVFQTRSEVTSLYKKYLPRNYSDGNIAAPELYKKLYTYDADEFLYYYTEFGFLPPPVYTIMPESKQRIIEIGKGKSNCLYRIENTDGYVLKVKNGTLWKNSTFEVTTRTSYFGRIKRLLINNRDYFNKGIIGIADNHNVLEDDNYMYIVLYFPHSDFPTVKLRTIE